METGVNMRFIKKDILLSLPKRKIGGRLRQWTRYAAPLLTGSALLLNACGGPSVPLGQIGNIEGMLGGVASDEPRATLVAEDILSSGGTAADAAAALYFTLAVTYPVAASLGGGGECLVYDRASNKLENLQFPNKSPVKGGDIAIPGNIRGITALQARYGKLDWSLILTRAEQIANFGEPLSRAQYMAMVLNQDKFTLDYTLEHIFKDDNGQFVAEGSKIRQVRLGSLLSSLRSEGGASFYSGNWARTFVEDASHAGGKVTVLDLLNYKPVWKEARMFRVDNNMVGVSEGPAGEVYEKLWQLLFKNGKNILSIGGRIPDTEIATATAKVFGEVNTATAFMSHGTTSFVTSDTQGNAVACVVGLKRPFGTGHVGNITGIIMAPNLPADEGEFLASPMLVVNLPNKNFYYGSAATGGAAATVASVSTALQIFSNDTRLEEAITTPRLFTMGDKLPLLYESAMTPENVAKLKEKFPVTVEVDRLASVNAIYCKDGKVPNCISRHDPRGYGLSMVEK
ncbi:MAG: hypothetical protein EP348_10465 [Alphaproteobacteria bacterium]|nr:MAG: hypothetical protein EP348_10465 [Alphaproteobacteria bacterium]